MKKISLITLSLLSLVFAASATHTMEDKKPRIPKNIEWLPRVSGVCLLAGWYTHFIYDLGYDWGHRAGQKVTKTSELENNQKIDTLIRLAAKENEVCGSALDNWIKMFSFDSDPNPNSISDWKKQSRQLWEKYSACRDKEVYNKTIDKTIDYLAYEACQTQRDIWSKTLLSRDNDESKKGHHWREWEKYRKCLENFKASNYKV